MALLKWGEEEEDKDELMGMPQVNTVQSVQNSWQPTQENDSEQQDSQQENYLMSDQKAQVDQQLAERREREEQAKAEASRIAIESENARRADAAAQLAEQQKQQTQETQPATKYTQPQKKDEGLWGFIKGIGSGIQQGLGAVGDIAIQGGGVIDYAGQRLRGVSDEKASMDVANRYGRLRESLQSNKDISGNNFVGTRDVEEQATRINNGTATLQDYIAVGGKGLQAGIDSTMFLNPARLAAGAIPARGLNPALKYAARDAAFFGGLQGGATTAQEYGQNGDIEQALKAGATDAVIGGLVQGGLDITGSGVNAVANRTLNSFRQPKEFRIGDELVELAEQGAGELTPVTDRQAPVSAPAEPPTQDGNVSFENAPLMQSSDLLRNAELTPVRDTDLTTPMTPEVAPVADGIAQPTELSPAVENPVDNLTPVTPVAPEVAPIPTPVADGTVQSGAPIPVRDPNMPEIRSEEIRNLQASRAGKSQADEAEINQRLQEVQDEVPLDNSLPDGMETPTGNTPVGEVTPVKNEEIFAKRFMTSSDGSVTARQQLANSVGLEKDGGSDLRTILSDADIDPKTAARITDLHDKMEAIAKRSKASQKANQKDFVAGNEVNQERTRASSSEIRELGVLQSKFNSEIDRLKRQGVKNIPEKLTQGLQNISSGRLANMLSGSGLIERNVTQELLANAISTVKNPIKTTRGAFNHGSNIKSAVKSSADGWKDTPKTPSETYQYILGNAYRTAMTGADAAARARAGGFRTEMTQWAYKELMKQDISPAKAEKLSRTAGNVTESMVNMMRGVDNGMVSNTQAMRALKQWKKYIQSGNASDLTKLDEMVSKQSTLADAMVRGFNFKEGSKAGRLLTTMVNSVFPFMRTAYNLTNTGVTRNLNLFAKSLLDEVRADQRSGGKNAALIIKNKLVDYGIIGGAVALVQSDVIQYNDGDDVDKPRGISIKIGDNEYVSIRATPIELPLAVAATVGQIVKDTAAGKAREPKYYAGMLSGSLPYIDQLESDTGLIDSVLNIGGKDDDGGYALKSYGVNLAKSHVPGSNNGLEAYLERWKGNSLNAKKVYDEDPMQWLYNSVMSSYDPKFRDSLDDSRDNAGRVRTVDNQGSFIRKNINDENTAIHNETISNLVDFARENKLGNGTQEMFNTYDTGKNNNFKSVQDAITFLDVEDGGKPDAAKKLEQNEKISQFSNQIRDGFYGETGNELLTLGGEQIWSDVSIPNADGTKNSRLPLSMQSIKNAVAATDLPKDQRDRMYEISQANQALYSKVESKEWTYDQYKAAKADAEKEYVSILSNSGNYKKMTSLMNELDGKGFFEDGGIGSTKSGQTYLWNSLNALLGSKGATPAAEWADTKKGFTPFGRGGGSGSRATVKPGKTGTDGVKWTPVQARKMATVKTKNYTPVSIKVKLGNEIKKNKTQNYSDRTF